MNQTDPDLIDKATKRITCDACGQRITEQQASIFSGTVDGARERWHLGCWPYRPRVVELQERLAP